ncbi:MAG TPA: uroporphyrinogen-III synthase [Polyangiaceae bacterium]|jgi:uroporphyrinogen III methyltransferase/synthase|nr:uroporphyrinogen-III synthase [Polyangiaceae bacterium]
MGHGLVCFVGAGPGDPALHTERAARRIAEADAVVGAGVGEHGDEAALVERMIALAREGKRVVRVVAGDPLESPEVVAQARALVAAGVAIEVVPGIGARSTAASFAGVLGPAVFVAGADVAGLRSALAGAAPGTRVTLVVGAASASQRVVVLPLEEVVSRAAVLAPASDLLVVAGEPDEALRWAERRPLFGRRILVTRALEQAGSTAALLRDAGAEPVVVPTIEIRPPADASPLAGALVALRAGAYHWVAFTSPNGVDRTWEALAAMGADTRAFGAARVAAIGPATARAVERHGLRPDVVAKEFRGERLAEAMLSAIGADRQGEAPRVLLPRAAKARDVLPEILRAAGCTVDVVPAYETHPPPAGPVNRLIEDLTGRRLDAATFTSSSTVDNFCDLLGSRAAELLGKTKVASIGPITTASAERRGLRVDVTAREYTMAGLIDALIESYG